jgi:hypothetical protein
MDGHFPNIPPPNIPPAIITNELYNWLDTASAGNLPDKGNPPKHRAKPCPLN